MIRMCRGIQRVAVLVALLMMTGAGWGAAEDRVDINRADADTLARVLHGVGPNKARAIVEYRRRHGPFRRPDDLARVRGIGRKTVERNRHRIVIGGTPTAQGAIGEGPAGGRSD